jgi:hypothetical protein
LLVALIHVVKEVFDPEQRVASVSHHAVQLPWAIGPLGFASARAHRDPCGVEREGIKAKVMPADAPG